MKLKDLKVGDKVCYVSWGIKQIATVTKITKTMVYTGISRYKISNGYPTGNDPYCKNYIKIIEDIDIDDIRHNIAIKKINSIKFETLSTDKLNKILDIINNK